jgi:hypothetical protein
VSNQVNSVSMDFAYGALHKCGLTIDADCLGGRQLVLDLNTTKYTIPPFEWNYTVSVTNQYVLAPCPGVSCSCWHSPPIKFLLLETTGATTISSTWWWS